MSSEGKNIQTVRSVSNTDVLQQVTPENIGGYIKNYLENTPEGQKLLRDAIDKDMRRRDKEFRQKFNLK